MINESNPYGDNKYARILAKISEMEANEPNILNRDITGIIAATEAEIQNNEVVSDQLLIPEEQATLGVIENPKK